MIELRMLGRLSLTAAEGREVRTLLGQPRRFALLAYLAAATPPGFHRRDSLVALFWPELDQEHARAALRQALRVLRAALGAGAVVSRGDEEVGLDVDRVWCDVAAFDRAVDGGALREALELYRGPLLEGFFISDGPEFERCLERERARLREAAARAAQGLIEQCESRGNLTTATHWARRAVELAPNDEALVRRLISVLDHHGDRASALQAYQAFAQRLAAEYEAEPAAETQALVAAVRARARGTPPVPLPAVDLLPRLQAGLTARYRVERELARGRTATVFVAHDLKHDRQVALKVLHAEVAPEMKNPSSRGPRYKSMASSHSPALLARSKAVTSDQICPKSRLTSSSPRPTTTPEPRVVRSTRSAWRSAVRACSWSSSGQNSASRVSRRWKPSGVAAAR